ncbi:MAG: hypothetical protein HeimC3_27170 [Candidatus Heimdallarchaeota archaeon LC_3]|nr:MAG: hypothetical protein HeimC3_27170 [Candidatus Heimdallarchaeota archaeon LC_3]
MQISYGNNKIEINFPINVKVSECKPNLSETDPDTNHKMMNIILESKEWIDFLNSKSSEDSIILIIINDATRATPSSWILEKILPIFHQKTIQYEFLIATGSHRSATENELTEILSEEIIKLNPVVYNHKYDSDDDLEYCGKSPTFNTEIWVNKLLFNSKYDRIITINSVEPHYFGGWTGGRKSIIPGCAGKKTITQTHIHALSPDSQICKLTGNPVHDDFIECLTITIDKMKKPVFSFQLLQDSKGIIEGVYGGTIFSSLTNCVNHAKNVFQVKVSNSYDLVLLVLYPPLDRTFYQSHKAIENSRLIFNNKTKILLISPCIEGIGPNKFLEPFNSVYNKNMALDEFLLYIKNNYKLGYHKSAKILEISLKNKIFIKSEYKLENPLNDLIRPIDSIQEWIDMVTSEDSEIKNALVVLDAGVTVPIPRYN